MADKKITALTQGVPVGTDVIPYVSDPGGSAVTMKSLVSSIGGSGGDGWNAISATGTSGTLDAPSFEISFDADMTGIIQLGDRIKVTQGTVKKFIATKIGSYSGGATIITCYGGTDYTLVATATTAITNPYYSHVKNPFGFPASPEKWTVSLSDTSSRSQATPTQNVWYNLGSLSLSMPIGAWIVSWKLYLQGSDASAVNVGLNATLSTANNSESDADMTAYTVATIPAGSSQGAPLFISKIISVTSKTAQYCNARTISSGLDNIYFANNVEGMILTFRSAYL